MMLDKGASFDIVVVMLGRIIFQNMKGDTSFCKLKLLFLTIDVITFLSDLVDLVKHWCWTLNFLVDLSFFKKKVDWCLQVLNMAIIL